MHRFDPTSEFDLETSLYYYRARYYDSVSGGFISKIPLVSMETDLISKTTEP